MKNTSILKRIMGLALSLALLVSMMPMLASEVYAAEEPVQIYKADGTEATISSDYTKSGSAYTLKSNGLVVTTRDEIFTSANFVLDASVNNVTFKDCKINSGSERVIAGSGADHDQTINIVGECDFVSSGQYFAINFSYTGGDGLIFTSSDKNNSLNIDCSGRVLSVEENGLTFSGELNATLTGSPNDNGIIKVKKDFTIKDNANIKVKNLLSGSVDAREGITIEEGGMYMSGNSSLDVYSNGTSIAMKKALLVRGGASLKASSYHYVTVKTDEEAEFDTTGRVEITNYHSDSLQCKSLKALNKDGTILIRGTESTAFKLVNEDDVTLGSSVKMYGSTNLNEPENSITKEFFGVKWKKEMYNLYHPYFVIDSADAPIKAILIKRAPETPGSGGGGSTGNVDTGEIDKLKNDLASAEAKIKEQDEYLRKLIKTVMNTRTKVRRIQSKIRRRSTIKFNKIPGATVYEIQYKQSGKKWKAVKTKKLTKTFKKLKSGKRFYAKVRGIYEKGTIKVYGKWSTTKSVKVK